MTQRVLVIDDESSVREYMSDVIQSLGYEVEAVADGDSAVQAFTQRPAELVFVDFLLPRKNGFGVAEAIRSTSKGASVPLVMMSGVFKNPKTAVEGREKYRVLDFLSKPVSAEQITEIAEAVLGGSKPKVRAISNYSGRPVAELRSMGRLTELAVPEIFSAIRYDNATGILDLTESALHRRIYFVEGRPTFVQSNGDGESVGEVLLERGRLSRAEFERCRAFMKERKRTLQQSLLELKLVGESELATAYKMLAGSLLPVSIGMMQGKFHWRDSDDFLGRVPQGKFDPAHILFQGIQGYVAEAVIDAFFLDRETTPLIKTQQFELLLPKFQKIFGDGLLNRLDGTTTLRQLLREVSLPKDELTRTVYAACVGGMVAFPHRVETVDLGFDEDFEPYEEPSSVVDNAQCGLSEDAIKEIESTHRRLEGVSHFDLLGVTKLSTAEEIKGQFLRLAKKWHMDSFPGIQPSKAKTQLEEIFHHVHEAYETLSDASSREEYIAFLDRRSKGLPTDVAEILRGESLYDDALALMKKKQFEQARQILKEAIRLNPDPNYYATLGWATYRVSPKDEKALAEAKKHLNRAVKEQPNLPIAYQHLGNIAYGQGLHAQAKKWWDRCLRFDPDNIDANRGVRMLKQRNGRNSTKAGFIQRLRARK